ncbi:MAG: rod shape-determining protein RodA, partial [Spirochaetes bacterium]|nr:rod shape-determining protein RodA [Spirochaetota bacterium]
IAGAKVSHIGSLLTLSGLGVGIPLIVAYYKETGKMTGWLIQILANNNILITISVVLSIIALIAFMINFFVRTRVFIKFALALVIIPIGFSSAVIINSYLKPYQRKRIVIFIDPERDYYGAGFNIIQSKIAIGSGGLTGKGYLKGPQNQLSFLPEKRTDFVFSSFGEEWGFIGSMLLMGLYFLLIYRGVMIIYHARDMLGSLIATGIMGMFVFHIFINIGMATGMMPVTGLPLPFISYGGSSLLTNLIAIGLLFNIEMRRYVH